MVIIKNSLTLEEQNEIQNIITLCQDYDHIHLSYPVAEPDACHFLSREDDGTLISILGFIPYTDSMGECTAFTLPAYRKKGHFTKLLQAAIGRFPNRDILFPVSGECDDTLATLKAMEAELDSCELQMEIDLDSASPDETALSSNLYTLLSHPMDDESISWILSTSNSQDIFGFCQTSLVGQDCVCLHHVEILPPFRRKGLGTILISLLLRHLTSHGIKRIILQVSGDNEAAVALYKKTSFRVTETLSYYLY